jgi:tripartite-type tricarboxylate transporter receptor subunit TctC
LKEDFVALVARVFALALGFALLAPAPLLAQDYPNKPVRLIVGLAPGGPADIQARLMATWLQSRLGQPVVVENRAGASGNIGTGYVVNSPPDGYTVLVIATYNAINASLFKDLQFDFLRDIAPVAGLTTFSYVMTVTPSMPAKNVAEFITYAKANPGKLTYGSAGIGASNMLAAEQFKVMTGTDIVHVPYRGNGAAYPDLISGRLQVLFTDVASSRQHLQAGTIRGIGVTSTKPMAAMPDLPTVASTVPGYAASAWYGFGVPKGTPPEIIARLNKEINEGLKDPAMLAKFRELEVEPMIYTPAEFGAFMADETKRWSQAVVAAGLKAE